MYRISIHTEPEMVKDKPMYYWAILEDLNVYGQIRVIARFCGWSESITQAAADAEKHLSHMPYAQ